MGSWSANVSGNDYYLDIEAKVVEICRIDFFDSKNSLLQDAKIYKNLNTQEKTIVDYEHYLREMKEIFFRLKRLLKNTGYIIVIISDITSKKNIAVEVQWYLTSVQSPIQRTLSAYFPGI